MSVERNVACITVDDIGMLVQRSSIVSRFCSCSIPCRLCTPRPLLTGQVLFCKTLLPGFGFPIVITNASSVLNDPTAKLAKHGFGCDNRDLPRSVRIRQDLLVDEIILFSLTSNNLVQGPILVKQEIRISIA